jgi:predicted nucleic acid-binding protein
MPLERVVVNASPLIVLFKSGQAKLLPQLFGEILVPQAVWNEITAAQNDMAAQQLLTATWATPVEVEVDSAIAAWEF